MYLQNVRDSRIEMIEYDDGVADSTTHYYYDGWRVLTETETLLREYIYGNYLDEVLVMTDSTDDHYYTHDHLFSAVALLDEDGNVLERYEYDAYGKPYFYDPNFVPLATQESGHGNVILYTGQRYDYLDDGDLTLMYYKNRAYSPTTGRFLQRDPIGERDGICIVYFAGTGSPLIKNNQIQKQYADGASLYGYVKSNPMSIIDPLGLTTVIGPDVMPDGDPPADPTDIILPEPPKLKPIGSFDCCKNVLEAIEVVNEAVQTPGGCFEWFLNNSSNGEIYEVRVRPNWYGMCNRHLPYIGNAFFYTWPISNDIAACKRSCDDNVETNALLLLHEIGHHYAPTFADPVKREEEASKPMYACKNAVNNIINKKK